MEVSVVLCTYNPKPKYLSRVLNSLANQTLPTNRWELIIVDNNSQNNFYEEISLESFPNKKMIQVSKQGLIYARIAGTAEASTLNIVTVDDDTILEANYLEEALRIFESHKDIGIFGGRSVGEFEKTPPDWVKEYHTILCIKDLGENTIISKLDNDERLNTYPPNGPFLILYRKDIFESIFIPHFNANKISKTLGRKGTSLSSGEDNDIVMAIYAAKFQVGYFPQLKFTHIIPSFRIEAKYLAKLVHNSNKTWVQVLALHGIFPWKKISKLGAIVRGFRAYFLLNAWKNDNNYIKWKGACGNFEARSILNNTHTLTK